MYNFDHIQGDKSLRVLQDYMLQQATERAEREAKDLEGQLATWIACGFTREQICIVQAIGPNFANGPKIAIPKKWSEVLEPNDYALNSYQQ